MRAGSSVKFNYKTHQNTWSGMPRIEEVSSRPDSNNQAFFQAVGALLARSNSIDRFAVTLLHSHFHLSNNEILLDTFNPENNTIKTSVNSIEMVDKDDCVVPKSWSFPSCEGSDASVEIDVLTWTKSDELIVKPLNKNDALLLRALGALFRSHKVENQFGMALLGQAAAQGRMWVEGEDSASRYLLQEQLLTVQVESRNPIKTMWVFDEFGKNIITLGCCLRTRDNSGHTGRVH